MDTEEREEIRSYNVIQEIGKGSFAVVYRAVHRDTRHNVAIKTIKREKLSAKLFDNLQSEIDILKSLAHRHITKLIDIVRADRNIYLIMEYCAGGDLTNYIKKRGRVDGLEYSPHQGAALQYYQHPPSGGLDEIVVRSFLRQLARALKFMRQRDLIHRDIKPQNLLLNPASPAELAKGHPMGVPILKVADFGFARSLPNAMLAETLCGSPLYMAPEILRYEKYDAKADLWSVGAVLYEMSVGKPPFRALNHVELIRKIENSKGIKFPDEDSHQQQQQQQQPSSGATTPTPPTPVPNDIKKLIRTLLKRNPAERSSFEEFFGSTALARSKFPRPAPNLRDSSPPPPPPSPTQQQRKDANPDAERRESPPAAAAANTNTLPQAQAIPPNHRIIPPEVLDPTAMIPPSKFNFRRRDGWMEVGAEPGEPNNRERSPTSKAALIDKNNRNHAQPGTTARRSITNPLSTEGSIIPGETEEDGLLRREYVLVGDTRAVELNRAVDEMTAARRTPLTDHHQHRQQRQSSSGRREGTGAEDSPTLTPTTFPPRPHPNPPPSTTTATGTGLTTLPLIIPLPLPLSSSPSRTASNALNRALNLASKKLFGLSATPSSGVTGIVGNGTGRVVAAAAAGTGTGGNGGGGVEAIAPALKPSTPSPSGSPLRRPQLIAGPSDVGTGGDGVGGRDVRDHQEDELLASLEELAQKTDVLTHWADEMYEYVKAVPQKPLPDPNKFAKRAGEGDRHAQRRWHADVEAEYNAVTCVALYLQLMSFSQKGIDKLRVYQEHAAMRCAPGEEVVLSEGFDVALTWFKHHFIKCNDRAALVKTWLPKQYDGPKSWLDQLVYDRALTLSRTAARKELLDQATTPDECEKLYEESLWCLYALQDDVLQLQAGNPFMEEDRATIATWIKRTKLRLLRCRARMAMNDRDRLTDARADQNLVDVARYPPPWEAQPASDSPPPPPPPPPPTR